MPAFHLFINHCARRNSSIIGCRVYSFDSTAKNALKILIIFAFLNRCNYDLHNY